MARPCQIRASRAWWLPKVKATLFKWIVIPVVRIVIRFLLNNIAATYVWQTLPLLSNTFTMGKESNVPELFQEFFLSPVLFGLFQQRWKNSNNLMTLGTFLLWGFREIHPCCCISQTHIHNLTSFCPAI